MNTHLYGLAYSPWTERARWALDHHRIPYRFRVHVPMLGEPLLRWRARGTGATRATVPLLVHEGRVVPDSLAIVELADRIGSGPRLGMDDEARAFAAQVEPALELMRGKVTAGILADREALRESAMGAAPAFLAGALRPLAAAGTSFVERKYGVVPAADEAREATMRAALVSLREGFGGREHLRGERLSAEDLIAATMLQGVRPVSTRHIRLGAALTRVWTWDVLATEFADLLAWRDRLYARHRHAHA